VAGQLILGARGSPIAMSFKRFAQDRVDKFTVHLTPPFSPLPY
jgi:hypothetical protein